MTSNQVQGGMGTAVPNMVPSPSPGVFGPQQADQAVTRMTALVNRSSGILNRSNDILGKVETLIQRLDPDAMPPTPPMTTAERPEEPTPGSLDMIQNNQDATGHAFDEIETRLNTLLNLI